MLLNAVHSCQGAIRCASRQFYGFRCRPNAATSAPKYFNVSLQAYHSDDGKGPKDPHEILGVSKNASPEEVKRAFRAKSKKQHPDVNPGDPKATERFQALNEANETVMASAIERERSIERERLKAASEAENAALKQKKLKEEAEARRREAKESAEKMAGKRQKSLEERKEEMSKQKKLKEQEEARRQEAKESAEKMASRRQKILEERKEVMLRKRNEQLGRNRISTPVPGYRSMQRQNWPQSRPQNEWRKAAASRAQKEGGEPAAAIQEEDEGTRRLRELREAKRLYEENKQQLLNQRQEIEKMFPESERGRREWPKRLGGDVRLKKGHAYKCAAAAFLTCVALLYFLAEYNLEYNRIDMGWNDYAIFVSQEFGSSAYAEPDSFSFEMCAPVTMTSLDSTSMEFKAYQRFASNTNAGRS